MAGSGGAGDDNFSAGVRIRTATPSDASALARLRWEWAEPDMDPDQTRLTEFASALGAWMTRSRTSSFCTVADTGGVFVAMATLAVFDRVPNPRTRRRRTGDLQSVYVQSAYRGTGLGRRLVAAALDTARSVGVSTVTTDSTDSAISFYLGLGFSRPDGLLQLDLRA